MITSVMYSTTIEATYMTYTKTEQQKVYASMILSPLTFADIVLGEILWIMTKGLISGGTVLAVCSRRASRRSGPACSGCR